LKAGKYDITIDQGAGFELLIVFTADGEPVDFTGASARMHAREKVSSTETLFELTSDDDDITLGGLAGTVKLTMPAADTAELTFSKGVYDLEIAPAGREPYRLLEGSVYLSREVTR
jgi:hypothetical protein